MKYHIYSPYRVCPIGAHIDHQHGIVTGFAINKGIDLWFTPNDTGRVFIESENFFGTAQFDVTDATRLKDNTWGDYAKGAKYALKKRFKLKYGFNAKLKGSLPIGGLSSSAAVLVAYVMAFAKSNGIELTPMETVKIASEAEREYIGLDNGILDHACIVLGKKDNLLFLDCENNKYRTIRRNDNMPDFEIGIFFSGLTRSLRHSDYNLRVNECKTAAWNMLAYSNMPLKPLEQTYLRDIPYKTFEATKHMMPQRFAQRAEHFYSEYRRVRKGVTAWESGNLPLFGKLCYQSCESSINNYECGSQELITIYEIMKSLDGIYGGRFSGAGFKGACIAIVDPKEKENIKQEPTKRYLEKFPEYEQTFSIDFVKSDDGARFIDT